MNPNDKPASELGATPPATSASSATPSGSPSSQSNNAAGVVPPASSVADAAKSNNNISKLDIKNLFQQWQFWGMVAMGFVAIVGLIFGVYGFNSDAAQRKRADQLQADLDEANQLLVKYGTQLGIKVNEYGRPVENTEDKKEDQKPEEVKIASGEYIYLGEWGIKLKIPDGLIRVSYVYDGSDWRGVTNLRVVGLPEAMDYYPDEAGEMPNFADLRDYPDSNFGGLGILSRISKEKDSNGKLECPAATGDSPGTVVYSNAKYCFVYSHPQAVISTDETEQAAEVKAVELIQELLTKNISTF